MLIRRSNLFDYKAQQIVCISSILFLFYFSFHFDYNDKRNIHLVFCGNKQFYNPVFILVKGKKRRRKSCKLLYCIVFIK